MKSTFFIIILSFLSSLTTAAALPAEHTSDPADLIEQRSSTEANIGNSTADPDCAQGCGTPPNYTRYGVCSIPNLKRLEYQ